MSPVASALCRCGCGQSTAVATDTRRGQIKGLPVKFVKGHNLRSHGMQKERNGKWKGNNIGYNAAHQRLGSIVGKRCVDCGEPAKAWSLRKDTPRECLQADRSGARKGRAFSVDTADYEPRCHRCHHKYDGNVAKGWHTRKFTRGRAQ